MVSVRDATSDDLEGLCALLEVLPYDGPVAIDRDRAGSVLAEMLATPHRSVLVAEQAGTVVGSLDVTVLANITRNCRPHALVENVIVAPDARRAGVGRALIDEAIERARAAGCYKVQLLSNQHRVDAHRLYESAGFEPRATGYRYYF